MSIVLYYSPMSSSIIAHWALEELKIPYQAVKVDLKALDQKKPEFLKINPNGKVPTLVEDGTPMFESLAIVAQLGQKYGISRNLWPEPSSPAHAEALTYSTWGVVTVGANLMKYFYNTSSRIPAEQHHAGQAESALKEVHHHFQILEQRLASHSYILGNAFSLADVPLASIVMWANYEKFNLSEYPQIQAWLKRCTARPAYVKIMAS